MMGVEINDADLDRTHRLPSKIKSYKSYKSAVNAPPPPPPTNHRQVYKPQSEEFCLLFEKKLRGTNYLITESWTRTRVECVKKLEELRKKKRFHATGPLMGQFIIPNLTLVQNLSSIICIILKRMTYKIITTP